MGKVPEKDPYWTQQAYRFGVGPNDKEGFARMHFQLVDRTLKIRTEIQLHSIPEDIVNASKVRMKSIKIFFLLWKRALEQGSVFGQFVTPEEFADEVIKGLDPENQEEYEKVRAIRT